MYLPRVLLSQLARTARPVGFAGALLLSCAAAHAQYSGGLSLTLPAGIRAAEPQNSLQPWLNNRVVGLIDKDNNDQLGFAVGFRLMHHVALVGQLAEINRPLTLFNNAPHLGAQKHLAYGVDLVGTLPLFEKFSLMGNAGFGRTRGDLFAASGGFDGSRYGATGRIGLGLQYDINAGLGFRIGLERKRHFGGTFGASDIDADSVTIGARFRF